MHAVGNAEKNYDQLMPQVRLAAPFIKQGLQVGIDAGISVMAEAMPYCVMLDYERYCSELYIPETEIRDINSYDPDFGNTRRTQGKTKFPQCADCKYDLICEGPWREYPEGKGHKEFVAVEGRKIRSPREILDN
jgi:hypothetical protein